MLCQQRAAAGSINDLLCSCVRLQDLRLANADRNGGNILVRRNSSGQWELIPIDHGYCLPSTFEDLSFEWMYW